MITILENIINSMQTNDFYITDIDVYNMSFENGNEVNYMKNGRRKFLIHYILSGKRYYKTESESFIISADNVVFIADSSFYLTKSLEDNGSACSGVGICFDLPINNLKTINIKNKVYIKSGNDEIKETFLEIDNIFNKHPLPFFELK